MGRGKVIKKCGFKTKKDNGHVHSIAFNELTEGETLALINAIRLARTISPVAQDISAYLRNALYEACKTESLKLAGCHRFLAELEKDIDAAVVPKNG